MCGLPQQHKGHWQVPECACARLGCKRACHVSDHGEPALGLRSCCLVPASHMARSTAAAPPHHNNQTTTKEWNRISITHRLPGTTCGSNDYIRSMAHPREQAQSQHKTHASHNCVAAACTGPMWMSRQGHSRLDSTCLRHSRSIGMQCFGRKDMVFRVGGSHGAHGNRRCSDVCGCRIQPDLKITGERLTHNYCKQCNEASAQYTKSNVALRALVNIIQQLLYKGFLWWWFNSGALVFHQPIQPFGLKHESEV